MHLLNRWDVRATPAEHHQPLPGDTLIPTPLASLTHAVTIDRAPDDVWPWVAQMGAGTRAGWYSYDWIDNGRRPSARTIIPALQTLSVGMTFPALPGATDGFTLLSFVSGSSLVLGWRSPAGAPLVTWAFVLEPRGMNRTRLLVRARGAADYRFRGLPPWISKHVARLVHFVMQRRELLGLAARAESLPPGAARAMARREVA